LAAQYFRKLGCGRGVRTRIVIADDHESVLRSLREFLTSQGDLEVCGDAVDGEDAVAKVLALRPDLVVLDLAMPRMDGLSAAEKIHNEPPALPIILYTLYGSIPEKELLKRGIHKVVEKVRPDHLLAAIREIANARLSLELTSPSDADAPCVGVRELASTTGPVATIPIQSVTVVNPASTANTTSNRTVKAD